MFQCMPLQKKYYVGKIYQILWHTLNHQWETGKLVFVHRLSVFGVSVSETHYNNSCQCETNMVSRHKLDYSVIIANLKIA